MGCLSRTYRNPAFCPVPDLRLHASTRWGDAFDSAFNRSPRANDRHPATSRQTSWTDRPHVRSTAWIGDRAALDRSLMNFATRSVAAEGARGGVFGWGVNGGPERHALGVSIVGSCEVRDGSGLRTSLTISDVRGLLGRPAVLRAEPVLMRALPSKSGRFRLRLTQSDIEVWCGTRLCAGGRTSGGT